MNHNAITDEKSIPVERLLEEVHRILGTKKDLNEERATLKRLIEQIVEWKDDNPYKDFMIAFEEAIYAISHLDFSKNLPLNPEARSIQNVMATAVNYINESLLPKVFDKDQIILLLDTLRLDNCLVVMADMTGNVVFYRAYTNDKRLKHFLPEGQHISCLIGNLSAVEKHIRSHGYEQKIKVVLKPSTKEKTKAYLNLITHSVLHRAGHFSYLIFLEEDDDE